MLVGQATAVITASEPRRSFRLETIRADNIKLINDYSIPSNLFINVLVLGWEIDHYERRTGQAINVVPDSDPRMQTLLTEEF
jgi:hypothetical protein